MTSCCRTFTYFALIVYSRKVLTAVSLILGIFVRFWSVIGALQLLYLWLGLYNSEGRVAADLFLPVGVAIDLCGP